MENGMTDRLAVKRFDSCHTVEAAEDFSLPDYVPEVRRVVGVQASASVDGKYLNGDTLEADGCVNYTVLYLGGEGGLCAVPLSSSFEGKIPVKTAEGDTFGADDVSLAASAENITCRVTAPRRLTLSSRVKLRVFSQRIMDCRERIEPEGFSDTVHRKRETVSCAAVKTVRFNGECGGELREREGTKVISAQGSVHISEAKPAADGIAVSGEGRTAILVLTPEGVYTTVRSRCAIDTVIPCGTEDVRSAAAYGRCLMCEVEAAEDGLITWNMEFDIDCDAVTGGDNEITADAYSSDYSDVCTYSEVTALSHVKCVNGRLTVTGSRQIRPGMTWAGGWGRAVFDHVSAERNGSRLVITGTAYVTSVLFGEGEAVSEEIAVPVKYECETEPAAEVNGDPVPKCEILVCEVSGRCDGDTLNVSAELAIGGVFLAERNVRYLESLSMDAETPVSRKKNMIRICVPDGTESEWDIMKRYRAGEGALKKAGRVYLIG